MLNITDLSLWVSSSFSLRGLTFHLEKGELIGVVGPNGAGKSTLVQAVSGLLSSFEGSIQLNGLSLNSYSSKEKACIMSVLPQEPLPPVAYTVGEVLRMGRYARENFWGAEKSASSEVFDELVAHFDLDIFLNRPLNTLSGGERQRVALAKALMQEPQLLILDEPTTFLDPGRQIQFMNALIRWQESRQMAVLAVLHDLNLAARYCNRLLLMQGGQTACLGTPDSVLTGTNLKPVYGVDFTLIKHPVTGVVQVLS